VAYSPNILFRSAGVNVAGGGPAAARRELAGARSEQVGISGHILRQLAAGD
jgi:hypothetical protein